MSAHVDPLLAEWDAVRDRSLPVHLQAVETAIFLEDTFEVALPDAAIGADLLTLDGMRAVLASARIR